jgi:drug/metabolite transporter (DMT)-like permease
MKKPLNVKHFILTVISFVGILLVIQPDFLFGKSNSNYEQYKYFLLFSLAAAFTNSFSMSYLHDLKGKVSGTVALHYFYIGQCLFNSFLMMFE